LYSNLQYSRHFSFFALDGKKGYAKHMEVEHQEHPVMYPCDICGVTFPEKDMTASTEDYYPHWISHFYFNK